MAATPRSHRHTLAAGVALGLLAGVLGAAVASLPEHGAAPSDDRPPPAAPAGDAAPAEGTGFDAATGALPAETDPVRHTAVVQAVQRVAPAVVSVTTEVPVNDPFARHRGASASTVTEGSGVVIQADGLVLTNAHVVAQANRIVTTFADGTRYDADILGIDQDLDLAVLQLRQAKGLATVEIGSSADLMLGEPVIAIGNPFGLGHTVTTGVISATRRPLQTDQRVYQDFLQTDASINPGNSGGPLLDAHGRLIGITTAIRADAQGIGFAIPVDRAIKVAMDLSRYGQVRSPWLGVDLEDVYVRDLDVRDLDEPVTGERGGAGVESPGGVRTAPRVVRSHAVPGDSDADSDADKGLQPGDVIVAVEGRSIQGRGDLDAFLAGSELGGTVHLTVRRPVGDHYRELKLGLAARPLPDSVVEESMHEVLGIELSEGAFDTGVPVKTVLPGGAFARVGGRPGDRIAAINGRALHSADELRAAVAATKSAHRDDALVTIRRSSTQSRITLPL